MLRVAGEAVGWCVIVGHPSSYLSGSELLNFNSCSHIRTFASAELDNCGCINSRSYSQLHQ